MKKHPNIDRTLDVTKEAMKKHPNIRRPDTFLLELLETTLKNNDFTFNSEYFLQICSTAMGKTYSPGLADLYLEIKLNQDSKLNLFIIIDCWTISFLFG